MDQAVLRFIATQLAQYESADDKNRVGGRPTLTRVINLLRRKRKIASQECMNGNAVLRFFLVVRYEAHMTKLEKGWIHVKKEFIGK